MMLLINHAIASRNGFGIAPFRNWMENIRPVVGYGLCTLHAFINHSCLPHVRWLTRDREHFVVATRPIKGGEQVNFCVSIGYVLACNSRSEALNDNGFAGFHRLREHS